MTKAEYDKRRFEIEDLWAMGWISTTLRQRMLDELLYKFSEEQQRLEDEDRDRVTDRLMADALKTHGRECCPRCGDRGKFIRMALVCPWHGPFGGV